MLTGSLVNFVAILVSGIVGSVIKRGIPKRIVDTVLAGMGLCVVYVGVSGLHLGESGMNPLVIILSIGIGAVLGELLDIDGMLNRFGSFLESKLVRNAGEGDRHSRLGEAFVTTTLIFCVGAMAINGALMSAQGSHDILFAKSVIDAITCLALATTLGIGCCLSAFSTLIYQGGLTLLFYALMSFVNSSSPMYTSIINHIGTTGSLIIIAIGLNMLGVTRIKTANYIPAMLLPLLLCPLFNLLGIL